MASVDTSIDPTTTGAAARLAAKHSVSHPMKLYGGWFCPFVQRVWIVLCEKDIQYQYIEINPYKKEVEFLKLNPRGLVPTLAVPVDAEGKCLKPLYESTVICEYLDEQFSDEEKYGPALLPTDIYRRAWCRLWIDHISSRIVPSFYKLLQHTPEKEYSIDEARQQFRSHIMTFVKEMESGGPWFLGPKFTLVDVCLAPWAKRLWLIDYYKPGGSGVTGEDSGGEGQEVWSRWREWLEAVLRRQSVNDTWSDKERYIEVYRRYAEDTTGSLVGQATRKGQRLP